MLSMGVEIFGKTKNLILKNLKANIILKSNQKISFKLEILHGLKSGTHISGHFFQIKNP